MTFDEIKEIDLKACGIYELREIGRQIGVQHPTMRKRNDLENEIRLILDHKKLPWRENPKIGRKAKKLNISFVDEIYRQEYIAMLTEQLEKEFEFIKKHIQNFIQKIF